MGSHAHNSLVIRIIYHLFMGIRLTSALVVYLHCFLLFRCWVLEGCSKMTVWGVGKKFGGDFGMLVGFALLVSL